MPDLKRASVGCERKAANPIKRRAPNHIERRIQIETKLQSKFLRPHFALFGILFLGLFLRLYHLGSESFWLDEGYSISGAKQSLVDIFRTAPEDLHPPLYFFLLHGWFKLFGDAEFSARLLSTLFGLLSVFAIFKLGSLLFDEETGLIASLIMSVSVFHVYYSQELRSYTLMAFLAIASFYFFCAYLKQEGRSHRYLVWNIVLSFLLLYTHSFAVLVVLTQNLCFLLNLLFGGRTARTKVRPWVLSQFFLFISYLPWIISAIKTTAITRHNIWIPKPSLLTFAGAFYKYAGSVPVLILFGLAVLFLVLYYRSYSRSKFFYFLLVWLFITVGVPFAVSLIFTPVYVYRYLIAGSVPAYLLVAFSIRSLRLRWLRWAMVIALVIFSLMGVYASYATIDKEQWREAASYVDAHAQKGDLVVFSAGYCQMIFDHYSKKEGLVKREFPKLVYRTSLLIDDNSREVTEQNVKELPKLTEGYDRVWLVISHGIDSERLMEKALSGHYSLVTEQKYVGVRVLLFRLNPS